MDGRAFTTAAGPPRGGACMSCSPRALRPKPSTASSAAVRSSRTAACAPGEGVPGGRRDDRVPEGPALLVEHPLGAQPVLRLQSIDRARPRQPTSPARVRVPCEDGDRARERRGVIGEPLEAGRSPITSSATTPGARGGCPSFRVTIRWSSSSPVRPTRPRISVSTRGWSSSRREMKPGVGYCRMVTITTSDPQETYNCCKFGANYH